MLIEPIELLLSLVCILFLLDSALTAYSTFGYLVSARA